MTEGNDHVSELDDRSLIERSARGDEKAARALVERHAGGIHAHAHARLGSALAASNTVDVFAITIESLEPDSFENGSIAKRLRSEAINSVTLHGSGNRSEAQLARLDQLMVDETRGAGPAPPDVVDDAVRSVMAAARQLPAVVFAVVDPVHDDDREAAADAGAPAAAPVVAAAVAPTWPRPLGGTSRETPRKRLRRVAVPLSLALLLLLGSLSAFALFGRDDRDGAVLPSNPSPVPSPGASSAAPSPTVAPSPTDGPSPDDGSDTPTGQDSEGADPDEPETSEPPTSSSSQPPNAQPDAVTVATSSSTFLDVLANDTDPNGDLNPQTLSIVQKPLLGKASVEGGRIRYVVDADVLGGSDRLTYEICDRAEQCTTDVPVTITIDPEPNSPPMAEPDTATTAYTTPINVNVAKNDTDPDGNLRTASVTVVGDVQENDPNGSVTATKASTSGNIRVTPGHGFEGVAVVTYQICDTRNECDTASLTVTVAANVGPTAKNDAATTKHPNPVIIAVLDNDSDPDDGIADVSLSITSGPTNGTAKPGDGQIQYTPKPGSGNLAPYTDKFTYTICDFAGKCDTATVTVTVNAST